MIDRLTRNWVYGGFLAGILILFSMPLIWRSWSLPIMVVFLQIPIYMLHQYEEHDNDRFRAAMNQMLGAEVLTHLAVFLINIVGVWFFNLAIVYLSVFVSPSFGLGAIYVTLANALVHIAAGLRLRCYNPGLVTALALFVPFSIWSLWVFERQVHPTLFQQLLGMLYGFGMHGLIVAYMLRRRARLLNVA